MMALLCPSSLSNPSAPAMPYSAFFRMYPTLCITETTIKAPEEVRVQQTVKNDDSPKGAN
jgi:hypothetical protein